MTVRGIAPIGVSPSNFPPAAARASKRTDRRCKSGKIGYRTYRKALRVLEALRNNGGTERHAYRCPSCGGIHLTSQERRR